MSVEMMSAFSAISIHALVKRATLELGLTQKQLGISIHALVKRATCSVKDFAVMIYISIHALVKRATALHVVSDTSTLYFNPRPREKGDSCGYRLCLTSLSDFNPRPREKGDILGAQNGDTIVYFNPRPREKGDKSPAVLTAPRVLFQSTPS